MTGTPQLFPFPSKMLLWATEGFKPYPLNCDGLRFALPSYPNGPDLPGHFAST